MLATHSFATCFPEGWPALAAKTTLAHEGDFRRSLHTAPFTCPFLVDAVVVLGVAFVPFIHFWVGVAFIPSVEVWIAITSRLGPTPSGLYFKAALAERCPLILRFLPTSPEVATGWDNSHCDVDKQSYIRMTCDAVRA